MPKIQDTPATSVPQAGMASSHNSTSPLSAEDVASKMVGRVKTMQRKHEQLHDSINRKLTDGFMRKYRTVAVGYERQWLNGVVDRNVRETYYNAVGALYADLAGKLSGEELQKLPQVAEQACREAGLTEVSPEVLGLYLEKLAAYPAAVEQFGQVLQHVENVPDTLKAADAWRLTIDGERQHGEAGYYTFDADEPGYVCSALSALGLALEQKGDLTEEGIVAVHRTAVGGVHEAGKSYLDSGYRTNDILSVVGMKRDTISLDGLRELRERISTEGDLYHGWIEFLEDSGTVMALIFPEAERAELAGKVSRIAAEYNEGIKQATTDEEKLTVIATMARSLDQIHPFKDGNLRTAYLLLNAKLIESGMPPTILDDPNKLDGHTTQEVVALIKEGQQRAVADMQLERPEQREERYLNDPSTLA